MLRKLLKIVGIVVAILVLGVVALLTYVKTALPDVGPAPEMTVDTSALNVQHGRYLAMHVTVCVDCHSTRDMTRFAGPIVPGTMGMGGETFDHSEGFPGSFYSLNITPAGLGTWTDGEIYRTITTGVTKEGKAIFPVMPYPSYGHMDPRDVKAIIAFVRTLKPIAHTSPARTIDFPMNFIINTIPKKATPVTRPPASDTIAYGGYLVEIAGCKECHTKQDKGKVVGPVLAGGWDFHMPDGSIVTSANITPDKKTGIGNWTKEAFISRFRYYADSGYTPPKVHPGEMQTIMPWIMYGGMDTTDLGAIYAYLHSIKPVSNHVVHFTPAVATK